MTRDEKAIVSLMGCSHALNHGFFLIYPAVLLLLQKEFSIDYLNLGWIGNIMNLTYGLGALPVGLIYNRLGPKRLYLLCFLGLSLASIGVGISSNLFHFTVGLAFFGVAGSIYHPLANALITGKVRDYGKALGIHGSAGNLGLATTPFMVGLIASWFGWRHAYLWFALPGIAVSIWALFVDMSLRKETEKRNPSTSITKNLKNYFSLPLICLYLINIMIHYCFVGSITFLPTCLAEQTSFRLFSLDNVAIGGMLSAFVLFMGVFGQFVGGILAQKPHLERRFLLVNILSFPFILAMSFTTNLLLLFLGLVFFFLNFFLQPMTNTLLARYTTLGMRGTAFGIFFFVAFCLGSFASTVSGFIAQQFGLRWVFLGIGGSVFLLILLSSFLLRIRRFTGFPNC